MRDYGREQYELRTDERMSDLKKFRHECEIMLRRIVSTWADPHMNPFKSDTEFIREWWAREMTEAEEHIKKWS